MEVGSSPTEAVPLGESPLGESPSAPHPAAGPLAEVASAAAGPVRDEAPPGAASASGEAPALGEAPGSDQGSDQGPLSAAEIEHFVKEGYVMLPRAFPRRVADDCRGALWRHMKSTTSIDADDSSSWRQAPHGRLGIAEVFKGGDIGGRWAECWTPRLRKALDQLCGRGKWVDDDNGCGWWVITFPGVAAEPWGAEGAWHVDGHGYQHFAHSAEIGALPIFLFSDIAEGGGGTALAPRSHSDAAEALLCAGRKGLAARSVSEAVRETCAAQGRLDAENAVETRGDAGDVMLTHPFLLHARSKNLTSTVRFMCHPAVSLKAPMRLFVRDAGGGGVVSADRGAATPVERAILEVVSRLESSEKSMQRFFPDSCEKTRKPSRSGKAPRHPEEPAANDDPLFEAMGFATFKRKR
ncbi:hypothetical protein M885DRAFT_519000 [Pelagophyceae sp. CCMP2097]|nr:hypothetical protein M885DRAFT_519000 [Pelagophyceae sp. CCMP2097]|mmetsp:Transcript_18551/g.66025  ORF Transcript_18551/g.66025 Transcript_18551/m.66025 type:complete len:410 (-) Transcript_18551:258-1487(-)